MANTKAKFNYLASNVFFFCCSEIPPHLEVKKFNITKLFDMAT